MEKGIRKIEQNGVHVAYFTCPQIKLNKYKDATMLSLWHIKGDSMDFILDMPELQDIRMYLQLIIPQYFISNKSGIWSLSLIVHSKG